MVYFDNAATTFPKPENVYSVLDIANRQYAFNSGRGSYKKACEVDRIIEETRTKIAKNVGGSFENVIFTCSATDSLNKIIMGLDWNYGDVVYISPFEHNSIIRPLEEIKRRYQIQIIIIPFDENTWEPAKDIESIFAINKPKYIFCSAKSNVTGLSVDYLRIFKEGKKYNSTNILDASQSFGVDKTINMKFCDFIVFAGHKSLYASFGVAGFIMDKDINLKHTYFGGTGSDTLNHDMPNNGVNRYEAGSHNSVAIYSLNESLNWLEHCNVEEKEIELTTYAIEKLKAIKKVVLYLPEDNSKIKGIISFNVDGYTSDDVGKILDEEYDICVRTGYHCAPYVHDFLDTHKYAGTVRISFGYFNTIEEVDTLVEAIKTL